jgi:hypothetical protein
MSLNKNRSPLGSGFLLELNLGNPQYTILGILNFKRNHALGRQRCTNGIF